VAREPEASDPLRQALARIAADEASELLAEGRFAARARVRSVIEDTLVEELLHAVARERLQEHRPAGTARQRADADVARPPTSAPKAPERELAPTAQAAPSASAWWVYCVIAAGERDAAPIGFPGVEASGTVELVQEGELIAVVSPVPLSQFSDERLREHLNDVEWVERVARSHESVLERALQSATIVPLRLCTLYNDRDGVARMLREQEPVLRQALQGLEGRREWGVKLFVDPERLAEEADADEAPTAGGSSGAAYMARRQRERQVGKRARELGDTAAYEVHARLERVAESARANPLQRPEVHGREARMLLNGAYLVAREREHEFEEEIESLREQWEASGFQLALTGPWPPYNFVSTSTLVMP
jgi:hypothetical protein